MLERQLSTIIAQHLNKFLRNIPEEQLNISLWAGEVALENVELQEDIFDQLSLLLWRTSVAGDLGAAANSEMASLLMPFTVVRGVIKKLRIFLPWSALESEPVSVEIDGMDIVLGPLRQRPYDKEEEYRRQTAIREVQLSAMEVKEDEEAKIPNLASSAGSPTASGLATSFVDRLVSTIVRNLQLTMRDVSIALAFDYDELHPSLASSVKLHIQEVAIVPTDDEWRPRFIQASSVQQRRLLHIGGVSVLAMKGRTKEGSGWNSVFTVVEPFDAQIKFSTPSNDDMAGPIVVAATLAPVAVNINQTIMACISDSIFSFTRALEFSAYRPFLPLLSGSQNSSLSISTRRWRFAFSAIKQRNLSKHITAKERMNLFIPVKNQYIALCKRSKGVEWLPPLDSNDLAKKVSIERTLEFDQIIFLRCLAKVELTEEARHVQEDRRRLQLISERSRPASSKGWLWWGGGGRSDKPSESPPDDYQTFGYTVLSSRRRVADALIKALADVAGKATHEASNVDHQQPTRFPLRLTAILPSVSAKFECNAVKCTATIENIAAGLGVRSEHNNSSPSNQLEVGSLSLNIEVTSKSFEMMSLGQASSVAPCFTVSCDEKFRVLHISLAEIIVHTPPPTAISELFIAIEPFTRARYDTLHWSPPSESARPLSFSSEAQPMQVRLSCGGLRMITSSHEGQSYRYFFQVEIGKFHVMADFLNDKLDQCVIENSTSVGVGVSGVAGVKLSLIQTEAGVIDRELFVTEALGIRMSLQQASLEIACGSLGGFWGWASLGALQKMSNDYSVLLRVLEREDLPKACVQKSGSMTAPLVSNTLTRVAIYSLDFRLSGPKGEAILLSGVSRENEGGLSPWMYVLLTSESEGTVACSGISLSSPNDGSESRIGSFSVDSRPLNAVISIECVKLMVGSYFVIFLEMIFAALAIMPKRKMERLEASSSSSAPVNQDFSLTFGVSSIELNAPGDEQLSVFLDRFDFTLTQSSTITTSRLLAKVSSVSVGDDSFLEYPFEMNLSAVENTEQKERAVVCSSSPVQISYSHRGVLSVLGFMNESEELVSRASRVFLISGIGVIDMNEECLKLLYSDPVDTNVSQEEDMLVRLEARIPDFSILVKGKEKFSEEYTVLSFHKISLTIVPFSEAFQNITLTRNDLSLFVETVNLDSLLLCKELRCSAHTNIGIPIFESCESAVRSLSSNSEFVSTPDSSVTTVSVGSLNRIIFEHAHFETVLKALTSNVFSCDTVQVYSSKDTVNEATTGSVQRFYFCFDLRQPLILEFKTKGGPGSITVSFEEIVVSSVSDGSVTCTALRFGSFALTDNTRRQLPLSAYTIDDERQHTSSLRLPIEMAIITCKSSELFIRNQPFASTTVVLDTIFVTCLYDSLRTIRDTIFLEEAIYYGPCRSTEQSLQKCPDNSLQIQIKNTSIFVHEAWLERVGSLFIPECNVSINTQVASTETHVILDSGFSLRCDSDAGPLDIISHPQKCISLKIVTPGSESEAQENKLGPIILGSIEASIPEFHVVIFPQFVRLVNTITSQVVPIADLFLQLSDQHSGEIPVKYLPTLDISVANFKLEIVQCISELHKPLCVSISKMRLNNKLVSQRVGPFTTFSDIVEVIFEGFSIDGFIRGTPTLSMSISRPLQTSTISNVTGEWVGSSAKFTNSSSLTETCGEFIFQLQVSVLFSGNLRVNRTLLETCLRISNLFGSIPTFPAHSKSLKQQTPKLKTILSAFIIDTAIELFDDSTNEIALILSLPYTTDIDFDMDLQTISVSAKGFFNVSDSKNMSVLKGQDVRLDVVSHSRDGTRVMISEVTLFLDIYRATYLLKVLDLLNEIAKDHFELSPQAPNSSEKHEANLSPDELISDLKTQQNQLRKDQSPLAICFQNITVEVAEIALMTLSKASIDVEANGKISILAESVDVGDMRVIPVKNILSVSHVSAVSDVGDVRVRVHTTTLTNDAVFFTDLATTMVQAQKILVPKIKIVPKSDEQFKQSLIVEFDSCYLSLSSSSDSEHTVNHSVLIGFPGLVLKSTQTTEGIHLSVDAIDGSLVYTGSSGCSPEHLCHDLRFRIETSSCASESSTRVTVGPVVVSAPLGESLRTIVTVFAENITPYAMWAKALMRGTSPTTVIPSRITGLHTLHIEVTSFVVGLYETLKVSNLKTTMHSVVKVNARDIVFKSSISPESERFEFHVAFVSSSTDKAIQPDLISVVPNDKSDDRDATSNYGIFVRSHQEFDLEGSRFNLIGRWGCASFVVSPQLIHLLDENVLRPAALGIHEVSRRINHVIRNDSFTSAERGSSKGMLVITGDYIFTNDVEIGGLTGLRIHIARGEGSPNVIHLRSTGDVTLHLFVSETCPIVIDEGISVYCHDLNFTTDKEFSHILDYVFCGDRSFFSVAPGLIVPRTSDLCEQTSANETYAALSYGMKKRHHTVSWSVRGQSSLTLCNNRDSFKIASDVEAEYHLSKTNSCIVEEKGFLGMPTLTISCNDGAISKHPVTLITHLEHHSAVDSRPAVTNMNVILDTTRVILTFGHAKLIYDTISTILPMLARAGSLGTQIDGITTVSDTIEQASRHRVTYSLSPNNKHIRDGDDSHVNITFNAPSLRVDIVDASSKILGWGGIEGLALQVAGTRNLNFLQLRGSCRVQIVDIPYAQAGERVLIDMEPEIGGDISVLSAGGTKTDISVAIPVATITLPVSKLLSISSYSFQAPSRGPYTISNKTDLRIRLEAGSGNQMVEVPENGSVQTQMVAVDRIRILVNEYQNPIFVDTNCTNSSHPLPFLQTSVNSLIINICHLTRTVCLSTGIILRSHLKGVLDPVLYLRWSDTFGFTKQTECLAGKEVFLPYAVGNKPLRFTTDEAESANQLPIEVLCGMARAAQIAGGKQIQFVTSIDPIVGNPSSVVVRLAVESSISIIEVFPMVSIRNTSLFNLVLGCGEVKMVVEPGNEWSWFSDLNSEIPAELQLSDGSLFSSVNLSVNKKTFVKFSDARSGCVLCMLVPVCDRGVCTINFSTGPSLFNGTLFPLEVRIRTSVGAKEEILPGLFVEKGLKPCSRHPLGYSAEQGDNVGLQIRVRPILPNVSFSASINVGGPSLTTTGVSCLQKESPSKNLVHVFSVSEKDSELCLSPMWCVHNNSNQELRVETGAISVKIAPMSVGGLTTFPAANSADPSSVFIFEGFEPSSPFCLASASQKSTSNTHTCLLRAHGGIFEKNACLTLTVDRRSKRQITVVASISETVFPFEIENRTASELIVVQRGNSADQSVTIHAFSSKPFAFTTLSESRALVFETVHGDAGRKYQHIVDPDLLPEPSDGWEIAKGLYMTALVSSSRCTFSLVSDRLLHASYLYTPRSITNFSLFVSKTNIVLSAPVGGNSQTIFSELADAGNLGNFAKINKSEFLAKREFDILAVSMDDMSFAVRGGGKHRLISSSLGSMIIRDVTWDGARHPIVVMCLKGSSLSSHTEVPWCRFSAHESKSETNTDGETTHLVALSALFNPLRIQLNDRILHTVIAVVSMLTSDSQKSCSENVKELEGSKLMSEPISRTKPRRLKIDKMLISPVSFILTYARRSDGKYDPLSGMSIRHLASSVEAAPFTLGEISTTDYNLSVSEGGSLIKEILTQLFVPVYRSNAVFQSYKIIGSLEILGNPLLFTSTVKDGVREFISSTLALNPLEGVSHLIASTGSGFFHTCSLFSKAGGRIVASATFDPQWLSECDATSNMSVLRGIREGATGVFTGPLKGAKSGGFTGALAGVVSGATGVIAKPVSGALLTMACASEEASLSLRKKTSSLNNEDLLFLHETLRNETTAKEWVILESSDCSLPLEQPHQSFFEASNSQPSVVDADGYRKIGPRAVSSSGQFGALLSYASQDEFSEWVNVARDCYLFRLTLNGTSRSSVGSFGITESDAAALERAKHLRGTLGVLGMLKYVTLDQFIKCVSWEEAKCAIQTEEFRKKIAPLMMKDLERRVSSIHWK